MQPTEVIRLDALKRLALLDTPPSESFDRITRVAALVFGLPIAAVSLTDTDRQWFKSRVGVDHWAIPRKQAPCAQVAETGATVVINDLLADPMYEDSHLARNGVRFYAGVPLTTADGFGLGALCVLGTKPRQVEAFELQALTDLSALVISQIELQHAFGRKDPISRLANRIQFLEDLDDLARESDHPRLAVLIDLIGAEQLNHAVRVMGPTAVDELVKVAAINLQDRLGPSRKAYQVSATQFAYVGPLEMDENSYQHRLIAQAAVIGRLGGPRPIGTPVIGVATFVPGEMASVDVLRMAQNAALDARASGRLISLYCKDQDRLYQRHFSVIREFEAAVKNPTELRLVYQPRVDMASGRCIGAEALLRWDSSALGPVSPGEFIPLIETSGLALPTTAWVLDTAIEQLAAWQSDGIDLRLSVNISAANLQDGGFAVSVIDVLSQHRVAAAAIELEITETAVMDDTVQAIAQLTALASHGITLAVDDFGTGYSSLSCLQRLPVHVLKIDQSFVKDLDTDTSRKALVDMMVSMAKHLSLRVVAEGVETERVLDVLRTTGCDEMQGYYFARPMPPKEFKSWFEAQRSGGVATDRSSTLQCAS